MSLTLSQARQKLYRYVSPTLDEQSATDRINSALERIYNSGKWKGLMATVAFNRQTDPAQWWVSRKVESFTLPRKFQSVMGVRFNTLARQVYPRWQEFIAGGTGQLTAGMGMQMIVDDSDGHVVFNEPTSLFNIRLEITDANDVGKVVSIEAVGADGKTIFDENGNSHLDVTLTSEGVTLPNLVAKITSVRKPITEGTVNLLAVYPDNPAQKCVIGSYEPTETVPSYKRYKVSGGEFANQITCMCKRRFVALVNGADDETVIVPGNEGALKMTLMALQYEDKNDLERAETYFQKAIQLLNSELKEDMGAPVITLQMNPVAAAMRIPARY